MDTIHVCAHTAQDTTEADSQLNDICSTTNPTNALRPVSDPARCLDFLNATGTHSVKAPAAPSRDLLTPNIFQVVRLSAADSGRNNNLNAIRFFLASAVIFSHSYVLVNRYDSEPVRLLLGHMNLGLIAVFSFFFISGYLILKSATRSTPLDFLKSRALRIFPGLIVVVILCGLALGPAVSMLPYRQYLLNPATLSFLNAAWLHPHKDALPGVFTSNPYSDAIDTPLWTLSTEWTMYVLTLMVCVLATRLKRFLAQSSVFTWALVIGVVLLTVNMFPLPHPSSFQWMVLYFLGCACYLRRDKILLSVPIALAVFFLAIMLFRLAPQVGRAMFPAALCYLIAAIGFHPAAYFESYRKVGDYSYGLYIYAWPIQQTIVWHFHSQQPLQLFAASYPLALMVAIASWHFIEDPSLQLKNRKRPIQGWITRTL